jgi:hypothetical protein
LLNARQSHRIGAVALSAISLDFAVMPAVQHRLWFHGVQASIIG